MLGGEETLDLGDDGVRRDATEADSFSGVTIFERSLMTMLCLGT